ncbi:mannose-1-phosphate guanylyltransferase/mannose-6-phosphate isomerase [Chitinasiproducens palmae]|uniref:mannose-1-phosphate guanylyltransferase n=1 Tax=Chitinasiproducens palmae TaxID=1770053 RepID=A0A1H2PPE4_9BURK|nr:mannose-1-phosphate guanylyltransferase/mannose-6-phosphate isomerase [Chitinasiproducens palmae]SDV48589.1 mannose-1-phosphate guanylyltransferase (GDP) /mannose-6-phosphate isomerase, type 2 [Chitinasiproducens palmae]
MPNDSNVPWANVATQVVRPLTHRIQPLILAGGAGSRLWPVSREHYPKQLIGLLGDASLLEATALRLDGWAPCASGQAEVIIVCGEDHRFMTAEQMRRLRRRAHIVLEPVGRNTAPALTLAALAAVADGQDAILVVMPADHAVADLAAFRDAVSRAAEQAEAGAIVTMGIVPSRPETGYGYIKAGTPIGDSGARVLEHFVEKPKRETAEAYLASGEYWWNSGIFIVRATIWLKAIAQFQPEMEAACRAAFEARHADGDFCRVDKTAFEACPADSIDYAVMEKLSNGTDIPAVVVPLDAGWSDVGSWDAVWDILPKDADGNVSRGRVMFEGSNSSYAHSSSRLIACVGLQDTVVIETPDAVLVANKSHVQDIKKIVGRIKAEGGAEAENHRKVHRPWGFYDSVDFGDRFQVKRIVVNPGAKLSLQMHYHRAEHWIVVRGTAEVTCGDKVLLLAENQSTYIPLGVTHRLANPGKTPLEIIEVQSGSYLGEDDIVRFDDTYGRK